MYNQIDSNKRKTWLLIFIFILVIAGVGYFLGYILGYGSDILAVAIVIAMATSLFGFFSGDKVALLAAGAKSIVKEENPYVYRLVENLCLAGGLPTPKIYIINDPAINAFATGRDPLHSSIAITAGAIERLENEELEGVIAHELSHIKNYDIRLMTIVIILVGIISLLSDWFLRISFWGGNGKDSNKNSNGIMLIIGLILIILSPFIAQLIKLAISRKREYLADASGALLTRYPEGLARALEKIKTDNYILRQGANATAHLYISNPFIHTKKFLAAAFSTHPPLDDRIAKLKEMA